MKLAPMNAEAIVPFLKQEGYQLMRTASGWWYNEYHQKRLYYPFPTHRLLNPTREEILDIFRRVPGAFAIRFLAPLENLGKKSFVFVRRRPYDIAQLSANARSKVRRGLKRCEVRPLSWDELIPLAQVAHRDTQLRHGEREPQSLGISNRLQACAAYEAWGAFVDGHLGAYLVTFSVDDWVHLIVNRSADEYLKFYPNNALVFTVTQQLLSRPAVSTVSYGWEPLYPLRTLAEFKTSMGFVEEPVRQRIIINPRMKALLSPAVCRVIEKIMALLRPADIRAKKLAGLLGIMAES